jgi:serine/threonine protein kinase/Flp pilus assembly protein TadD
MNPSPGLSAPRNGDDSALFDLVEEMAARLQSEEAADVEAWIAAQPVYADRLRRLLPTVQVMAELGSGAGGSGPGRGPDDEAVSGVLGDFRIVRRVGRGGMGVVYEAEQRSLKRRVALKVLPFAATLDPKQLQRFQMEAQAAAGLHHTNIVPVYGVGCERGVYYYAMQFIDGQTLAEVIRQLRQLSGRAKAEPGPAGAAGGPHPVLEGAAGAAPAAAATQRVAAVTTEDGHLGREFFRRVAQWGIQAAEALDHTHQLGVVHRDVKPANLLIEGSGHLWVTDFGLARIQSEASMTASGDVVGTLRYMSPEQALAKRLVIDHRTDVYSLGATLYELLTLQPVFGGTDRQELLRQIAFEEPKPPRRLDKAVPAELESIVLKALEKRPTDRYGTAQELADDLRRYVDDKPIQAKRPRLAQRARKWARRHRAVVGAAVVCLAVTLAVLAGSVGWVARDQAARRTQTEREANAALEESAARQREGRLPEALAAARRAAWVVDTGTAGASFRQRVQARRADLELVAELEEARLEMTAVKDGHFDIELGDRLFAEAFQRAGLDVEALPAEEAAERIRASSAAAELAAALDHWALTRREIRGRSPSSWQHLLRVARGADSDAWRDRLREALAEQDHQALLELARSEEVLQQPSLTLAALAIALRRGGAVEPAEVLLRQARQRRPVDFWANHNLAEALKKAQPARWDEVSRFWTAAVVLRPQSPGAHYNLGSALTEQGRWDEAIAEYQEAVRLKKDYSEAYIGLGVAFYKQGRLDEAIAKYQEALRLKKDDPDAHNSLGAALAAKGRLDEAIAEYQKALHIKRDDPDARNNLGVALARKGLFDEAIAEYQKSIRIEKDNPEAHNNLGNALLGKGEFEEAILAYRAALHLKKDYPEAHYNLGNALKQKGQLDGAIEHYQEAVRLKKDFFEAHGNLRIALIQKWIQKDDPKAHYNLGVDLQAKGRLDEAIGEFKEAIRLKNDFAEAHNNLGSALATKGRRDEAIDEFKAAIRFNKDVPEIYCNLGRVLLQQGQFAEALAAVKRGHELGSKNPHWPHPSAQLLRTAEQLVALEPKLPKLLKGEALPADNAERLALAQLCQEHKKLYVAATRFYTDAFAAEPKLVGNLDSQARYNAACAAALAGCGQGQDAAKLDDQERARVRRQSLTWLRADLKQYAQILEKAPAQVRAAVQQRLVHWQQDTDFAGVRGDALAKLPAAERQAWQQLWADVADMLAAAQKQTTPQKKAGKE